MTKETNSYEETFEFAREFARNLSAGDTVVLAGELGAGKTAFAKGVASAFGIEPDSVLSPTFTLCRSYAGNGATIHHCDLYRLGSVEEAYEAGIIEHIGDPDAILIVEWADVIMDELPPHKTVTIRHTGGNTRSITAEEA